jgi:hypothetical protein
MLTGPRLISLLLMAILSMTALGGSSSAHETYSPVYKGSRLHDRSLDQLPLLPGVELVGNAFDLLTASRNGIDRSVGSVFRFVLNQTTVDGKYSVPFGVKYGMSPLCARQVTSRTIKSSNEYTSTTTNDVTVGGSYKLFTGSYSQSSKHVRSRLAKQSLVVSISRTRCIQYRTTLFPGYAQLDEFFVAAVKRLPVDFTLETADQFERFLMSWNTHVTTGCTTGGVLEQSSFTSTDYLKTHTMDHTSQQASVKFYISIDPKASSETTVDKEFEQLSSFDSIESHGGLMQSDDQWSSWAASVQALTNPACLDFTAVEISAVLRPEWTADSALHARADALSAGIEAFFNRKGCMNPAASNYDQRALVDDNSCALPPAPPLSSRGVALVCGPNCDPRSFQLGLPSDQRSDFHSSGGWKCHCCRNSEGQLRAEVRTDPGQSVVQCAGVDVGETENGKVSIASCSGRSCSCTYLEAVPTYSPTPFPTPTASPTPFPTPTASPTPFPTPTASPTPAVPTSAPFAPNPDSSAPPSTPTRPKPASHHTLVIATSSGGSIACLAVGFMLVRAFRRKQPAIASRLLEEEGSNEFDVERGRVGPNSGHAAGSL